LGLVLITSESSLGITVLQSDDEVLVRLNGRTTVEFLARSSRSAATAARGGTIASGCHRGLNRRHPHQCLRMWRLAPRQLNETKHSIDRQVQRARSRSASSNFASGPRSYLCVLIDLRSARMRKVSGTFLLALVYRTNYLVPLFAEKGTAGKAAVSSTQIDITRAKALPNQESPNAEKFPFGRLHHCEIPSRRVSDYGLISGTCTSSTSIARPSRQSSW
jgi:hypothetical protein